MPRDRRPAPVTAALEFFCPGLPKAKGSPDILRNRRTGRPFVREKRPVVAWGHTVAAAARASVRERAGAFERLEGPVSVLILFDMPRKKTAPKRTDRCAELAAVKPDLDKLIRAVLDGLSLSGVVYRDDAQVVEVYAVKQVLPAAGGVSGVRVIVEAYTDPEQQRSREHAPTLSLVADPR